MCWIGYSVMPADLRNGFVEPIAARASVAGVSGLAR